MNDTHRHSYSEGGRCIVCLRPRPTAAERIVARLDAYTPEQHAAGIAAARARMKERDMSKATSSARQALARVLTAHRRPAVGTPGVGNSPACRCGDEHWAPLHQVDALVQEENAMAALLSDEAMLAELVKRKRLKVEMTLDSVNG